MSTFLNISDAKPGMRVHLSEYSYNPTPHNPTLGSKYSCEGIITGVVTENEGIPRIIVAWDNGRKNEYPDQTLILIEEKSGSFIDMWADMK